MELSLVISTVCFLAGSFLNAQQLQLNSSVLWNPDNNYIYPPGIPAVLEKTDVNRVFILEQYYSKSIDPDSIRVVIRGPWIDNTLKYNLGYWTNDFIKVSSPVCDESPSYRSDGELIGFRCYSYIKISEQIPSGVLGAAFSYIAHQGEVVHPNSVFWILLPELAPKVHVIKKRTSWKNKNKERQEHANFNLMPRKKQHTKIVRITKQGGFTIGSGFLVRDISRFYELLPALKKYKNFPCDGIFIVTAAHLFPYGFNIDRGGGGFGGIKRDDSLFLLSKVYNIQFNDSVIYHDSAVLLAKNEEADIAVLYLNNQGIKAVMREQNKNKCSQIKSFEFEEQIDKNQLMNVYGFTTESWDSMVEKSAYLAEYPTEDTSNFGPVLKLKFRGFGKKKHLAEDGMSGGPIISADGKVIGMTVERPVSENSLIGIDLTSLDSTAGHEYFLEHNNDTNCILRFNPFDRVVTLRDQSFGYCDYGDFGSRNSLKKLKGTWVVQEIMALADNNNNGIDSENFKYGGAYSWKNGHSIINGFTAIKGQNIVKSQSYLAVTANDVDKINANYINHQFKLDKRSWMSLKTVGVRILHFPKGRALRGLQNDYRPSKVISRIKIDPEQNVFTAVYSIRSFMIWLRLLDNPELFERSVCYLGEKCSDQE